MFADILILNSDSNFDQILTYSLPEGEIVVGTMAIVPVRNSLRKGIILRVFKEKPALDRIRPLERIIDRQLISPEGLKLALWVSKYYTSSLNKAVQAFLPPPVKLVSRKVLVPGENWIGRELFLGVLEKSIIDYVGKKSSQTCPLSEIKLRFGSKGLNALSFLQKNNYLLEKTVFDNPVREKKRILYNLNFEFTDWHNLEKRAPQQAAIARVLKNGPMEREELKSKGVLSPSSLKSLLEKGIIYTIEEERNRNPLSIHFSVCRPKILNKEQEEASRRICRSLEERSCKNWLLFGVTGSGKTEVYFKAIEKALSLGRQALYLVPEIALTPQVASLLLTTFGEKVAILHSALSPGERYDEWSRIKRGEAMVVLGPRSAIFAPFTDLGLIIIDEEHENSYKQNEPDPRYDARTTALELARICQADIVVGSATPSVKTFYLALQGNYELLKLSGRVGAKALPTLHIVDTKRELKEGNKGIFSGPLIKSLEDTVAAGEQAIIFLNRRGFHTYNMCRECGKALVCPNCSITLTYHRTTGTLTCHYCNHKRILPRNCPYCGSHFLAYYGTGTERVEEELKRVLPSAKSLRMDSDTTRTKGSHSAILKDFQDGKAQILIGTQMIAKGLDFPLVTLVGILNTDNILNMPDYQSSERAYQLITQVAGRSGRGNSPGHVIVQTFFPEHYLFPALIKQDYEEFYHKEIENRKMLLYPPFHHLLRILISGLTEKKTMERVDYLRELLKIEIEKEDMELEVLGPSPAPISFLKGRYRHHMVLKGLVLKDLQYLAYKIRKEMGILSTEPRVIIDVEPQSLL